MENMNKELTIPKWVLIVRPKKSKCLKNIQPKMSVQAQKFENFEISSLWVSVVRDSEQLHSGVFYFFMLNGHEQPSGYNGDNLISEGTLLYFLHAFVFQK
jgi:hypothetical protein